MKKKMLSILIGVSVLAATLAGCGQKPASTESAPAAPAAETPAASAESTPAETAQQTSGG